MFAADNTQTFNRKQIEWSNTRIFPPEIANATGSVFDTGTAVITYGAW